MSIDTVCDFLSGLPVRAMVVFFEWVDRDTDMRRIFEIQRTITFSQATCCSEI